MSLFNWKFRRRQNNLIAEKRTIILDTSALNSYKAMEIIEEEGTKVIILTGTILEMDNYKHYKGTFGNNLRTIARKCREDEKSEKFICVADYDEYSYQDRNIIEYCRKNKEVVILTSDNNLCNLAKAYNIPYMFIEAEIYEEDEQIEDCEEVKEVKEEEKEEIKEFVRQYIYFNENGIRFAPRRGFYTYLRLETEDGEIFDKLDTYKEGDFLYEILCSKRSKFIEITKFKIIKKDGKYFPEQLQKEEVHYMNEIFRLRLNEDIKNQIFDIFKENCEY